MDDFKNLAVLPVEVKSGKAYTVHSALHHFRQNHDYPVRQAYVFTNNREIKAKGKIYYLPVYYAMFLRPNGIENSGDLILP
ncbi:MAG: hypothetical protein J6Y94_02125 [Bacteriovoracaceae bacterium]|nr:hypothetical protein [Bacteriovoracaceae bacterium]